ncbi:hypothetical protein MASR1M45_15370 [Candidatus Kapaibacterium sp.]
MSIENFFKISIIPFLNKLEKKVNKIIKYVYNYKFQNKISVFTSFNKTKICYINSKKSEILVL